MKILIIYLVIINALTFLLMLIDKQKAKKNRWRIRESTLLGCSFIGGSVGGMLGMYLLRHKTLHKRFAIGIPLMFVAHLVALYLLWPYLH